MNNPYFICALPRSRTAWLSVLLSNGKSTCLHEGLTRCSPDNLIEDLKAILSQSTPTYSHIGDSDSGLPLLWPKLNDAFSEARYVFIDRPFGEAFKSHRKAFPCFDEKKVKRSFDLVASGIAQMKQEVQKSITIEYSELDDPEICHYIWKFCAPDEPFDFERSEMLQNLRVNQIFEGVIDRAHPGMAENIRSAIKE